MHRSCVQRFTIVWMSSRSLFVVTVDGKLISKGSAGLGIDEIKRCRLDRWLSMCFLES